MPKRTKSWSADQRRFMVWLATPEIDRYPLTQGLLAREMGRADSTLSDWKHIPGFMAEVNKLVDDHLMDDYAVVIDALKREARKGNFNHLKLFLELAGKYTPKQELYGKDGEPLTVQIIEVVR